MKIENMFYILEEDWHTLQAWAGIAYQEDKNDISGLMTAIPDKDGRFQLKDVEILKQENSGTSTELDAEAVSAYKMKHAMKYKNKNMKFVWWHSHHTMSAFWSGTDENEIDAWKNTSYSLALVINLKEEYKFRVSFWKMNGLPIEQHIDTTLTIEREQPKINITEAMKKKYKELCEERTIVNKYINQTNGYLNYNNQTNIWQRENDLLIETRYSGMIEDIESIQQSFLDGLYDVKTFKEALDELNAECKEKKFPFKIKNFKLKKAQLHEKLMCIMPEEFFDWENNEIKEKYEAINWNSRHGGWGYGI